VVGCTVLIKQNAWLKNHTLTQNTPHRNVGCTNKLHIYEYIYIKFAELTIEKKKKYAFTCSSWCACWGAFWCAYIWVMAHMCVWVTSTTNSFYVNTTNPSFIWTIHIWVSHGTHVCMSHEHRQLISMWTQITHSYSCVQYTCEWVMAHLCVWVTSTANSFLCERQELIHIHICSWLRAILHKCEWVMAHVWMSHGTCEWVMVHVSISHCTQVNESWHTCDWVMAHMWLSQGTHVTESWYTCECVMAHRWMSHGTHVNESWHTGECAIAHMWMNHFIRRARKRTHFYNSDFSINLFASAFCNGSGTQIVLLSAKRTHQLGFAERSTDNLETSPLEQFPTMIRGRKQSYQQSATHGKIALANKHHETTIMSTSASGVARISARRSGHPARAREPSRKHLLFL